MTSRSRRHAAALLVAASGVALAACGDDEPEVDRQAVLDELVADVYVPSYEQVVTAGETLSGSLDSLCADPDSADVLTTAQVDWSSLRTAWLATRSFRFGPAIDQRAMSDIDFAIDTSKIDDYLAGDEPVDEAGVGSLGADVRGMNAVEYVLFGESPSAQRECEYMESATALINARAERVLEAWTTADGDTAAFADQIAAPGSESSMYDDVADVYEDVINHMIFALGDVGDARLGRASGDVTGTPEPEKVDAGAAHRALQDCTDILAGVVTVYEGFADDEDDSGVRAVVASMSGDTAETLDEQFAIAAERIEAIPAPLADNTDPAPAHDAYEAVRAAQTTMQTEVASLLGVTLTFGDADGDS